MEQQLKGKVALVTGAAQGMGKEIANILALHGAAVVLNDIHERLLQEAVADIRAAGGKAEGINKDVSRADEIAAMFAYLTEVYGAVDIVVNNAGILRSTAFTAIEEEEWDRVMAINVKSLYLICKAALPMMMARQGGSIINMSSSAGRSVSTLGGAHYTTSKAAVLGLTRHLAKEFGSYNIRANAICPGLIDTEMVRKTCTAEQIAAYEQSFPIPRLGRPAEVAQVALFLASPESAYVTGASIDINGGDLMI